MPWIDKKQKLHECSLDTLPAPDVAYDQGAAPGSIYECDLISCGRQWVLMDNPRDGLYWSATVKKNTP